MVKRRKGRSLASAGIVLAVAAAGCSGGDDPVTATTEAVSPAADAPTSGAVGDGTGADDGWSEVVAQAEEEGAVTYYSDQNVVNLEALEVAFEEEYDIDLTFVRGLPTDLNPRVETELSLGQGEADVYTTADRRWTLNQDEAGSFTAPVSPRVAEVPDEYGIGDFLVTHGSTVGYGWNTELVEDGLSGYEDLLSEDLRGLIGVPEPTAEALADFYMFLEDEYGEEYVEALAELEPRVYAGGSAIIEAMTSGEIAATPYGSPIIENNKADGAPVDWGRPDVSWGVPFNTSILDTAPHPAAAQVLVDFILAEGGQTALGTNYITLNESPASIDTLDSIAPSRAPELTPDEVEEYRQKWRSLFQ